MRMNSRIPKQFLVLGDMPIVMHSINAFVAYDPAILVILVLPQDQQDRWHELVEEFNFTAKVRIVPGGKTRFHSVQNGLDMVKDTDFVAIHDAVRPLISSEVIERCFNKAIESGSAVASVPCKDSIRQLKEDDASLSVPRDKFRLVQTPQVFEGARIKGAYLRAASSNFTDDASVAENAGVKINLVEGDYRNIKITFPEDLALAEAILKRGDL